ncbi:unnamed protein product [Effrenium voratum]|uniref:Uncharacterized protein n=1 Tax=Effrenium voratum TaxID=2562239 RepID=A0AA36MK17_9DINO|nr:unnamed protein product [Effrenium voratum]CAJ1459237.1 unnamed protein product [Effrenium voratum]
MPVQIRRLLSDVTESNSSNDETRKQLLLLLSSKRVQKALRTCQQRLSPVPEATELSRAKLLKILAEAYTLWKKRPVWGARPDETWGLFLENVDDIVKPYCQGLALMPEEDWNGVKFWCTRISPRRLCDIVVASLDFHRAPEPAQVMRVSRVLEATAAAVTAAAASPLD